MEHMTLEQYKKLKKQNKYENEEAIVDGLGFDSKLEAKRWQELKLLQQANEITDLRRQVKFELQPSYKKNGKTIKSINYYADFCYFDLKKRKMIVEDTKRIFN